MKKLFSLLLVAMMTSLVALAQNRTIKGVVVDATDNEPLIGATVVPIGEGVATNLGASTDVNGQFALSIPSKVTKVRVSYIGYHSKDVTVASEMHIELESSTTSLDEVMVVAYGTATKSSFTGSAAVLKADKIEQAQVSNALNAIDGKVAGVQMSNSSGQPGSTTPAIRIRGISSINAGNAPLVVVDGAPYSGDINNINTQDIASMTVLKDAASNALYGARGANGVILITTKKGSGNGSATINLDAKWGVNSRATQTYNYIKDPGQYYELYYQALYNSQIAGGATPEAANIWANNNLIGGNSGLGYNVYSVPEGQLMIGSNGRLNPNATLGNKVTYNGQDYMLYPDNWLDAAYKNSMRQEYNLNVSKSTNDTNLYASFGYLDNEGITENSGYRRLTGRLTADTQVKSWLKIGGNFAYTNYEAKTMSEDGTSNTGGNVFAISTQMAPIYPLFIRDGNGNIMTDAKGNLRYDYGDKLNAGCSRPQYALVNGLSDAILNTNKYDGNNLNATGYVEIRFLKDFKFTSNNSVSDNEYRCNYMYNPYYGSAASSGGSSYVYRYSTMDYTFQQLLNWSHEFGRHNVSVLLGHENYWQRQHVLDGGKSNLFDSSNVELDGAISTLSASSNSTDYNNEGYLMRGQYDFNGVYFGSFSVRRDGSSRFHPDNRWGSFWSFGGAWIMSKESWFTAKWVDMLKVKASYGEQGNDNIGDFRYVNTYKLVNASGVVSAVVDVMGNKNITWEKNGNFNAGFDFAFFKERLSGSAEVFYRRTSDMLSWVPLPGSYGWTGYYDNIGNMENLGFELDLTGNVIKTKDFSWDLNFNLTWYKNQITSIYENNKTMTVDGHGGYNSGSYYYGEGCSLYTFYMPSYAGVAEDGQALYYVDTTDATGATQRTTTTNYNDATYYLQDSALPTVYGGFGTSFKYRSFDLAVDFAYSLGGKTYDSDYASAMASPTSSTKGYAFHADILKAWTSENTNTDVPRLSFGDQYTATMSDRFLISSSYLSLQNVNFGYTLPSQVAHKLKLQRLRFYVSADNVWLWSKRQGLDPRQSFNGTATASYYAPIRTVSGGLNLSF
jgi:TonB-linked SusC/RagA family outer membrane protein